MIGRSGERGPEISVLVARHDDDDDDLSNDPCIYCLNKFLAGARPLNQTFCVDRTGYSYEWPIILNGIQCKSTELFIKCIII